MTDATDRKFPRSYQPPIPVADNQPAVTTEMRRAGSVALGFAPDHVTGGPRAVLIYRAMRALEPSEACLKFLDEHGAFPQRRAHARGDRFIVDAIFARHEGFDEALRIVELTPGPRGGVTVFVAPPAPFDAKVKQEAERQRGGWMEAARQFHRNQLYYARLVDQIGELLGPAAMKRDDGTYTGEVLRAKVKEALVEVLAAKDARIAELEKQLAAFTAANVAPPESGKLAHDPFREFPTDRRRIGG